MSTFNRPESISGWAAMFRDLPSPVVGLLAIQVTAAFLTPVSLFLFCVTFPRRLIQSGWILALLCIPQIFWLVPQAAYSYRLVYDSHRAIGMFSQSLYLGLVITSA